MRLKELERMVIQQDKMTSLGRVAAGMAHEIRNPLSGLNIALSCLERSGADLRDDEEYEQILASIRSSSHKIEGVVRRVMDFAKPHQPNMEWVEIEPIVLKVGVG